MIDEKSQRCNLVRVPRRIKPIQACSTNAAIAAPFKISKWGAPQNNTMPAEILDDWMRDSVTEIVRNIAEAPFLLHVYSDDNTRLELEREEATADSWPSITRRWKQGCPIPDGVILVEQLDHKKALQLSNDGEEEEAPVMDATGTKAWGLLIQGKGVDTAACYILKTCRVGSSLGFCTHFCLVKAKCFGETAELQLQNSWNGVDN